MRNALAAVALTAVFTVGPCVGVLAAVAADDGGRIGRLDNFRPGAGLDTSQVVSASADDRVFCYAAGGDNHAWKCYGATVAPAANLPDIPVWVGAADVARERFGIREVSR